MLIFGPGSSYPYAKKNPELPIIVVEENRSPNIVF